MSERARQVVFSKIGEPARAQSSRSLPTLQRGIFYWSPATQ
jgi:hypothetical protein